MMTIEETSEMVMKLGIAFRTEISQADIEMWHDFLGPLESVPAQKAFRATVRNERFMPIIAAFFDWYRDEYQLWEQQQRQPAFIWDDEGRQLPNPKAN